MSRRVTASTAPAHVAPEAIPRALPGSQIDSDLRDVRKNVEINIGKTCNNKCVFCLDGMPTKEDKAFMPWDEMRAELDAYRATGHLSVGFLGGEPTTYPFIVDAVRHAHDIGFTRIALATNAMMLRRERFLDQLVEAGLNRVTVSMHGHTAELEDRLTMVPGGFEKKCTALRHLVKRRDAGLFSEGVSVNIVLNGWNYRVLPKMMKFFLETMDLADLRTNYVRPEGYAEGNPDLTPPYTKVVPVLMKAVLLNEFHFKKVFTFGGVPMCMLPDEFLRSKRLLKKYVGDVYRDLATDCSIRNDFDGADDNGVSEVRGGRARFNWQDRKRHDLKDMAPSCQRCALVDMCEGVWAGYRDIYGLDEFAPLEWEEGAMTRLAPRVKVAPKGQQQQSKKKYARRLTVLS